MGNKTLYDYNLPCIVQNVHESKCSFIGSHCHELDASGIKFYCTWHIVAPEIYT